MSLSGKNILVTGADGFIGSHLVERLVKEGANVTALLRSNNIGLLGHISLYYKTVVPYTYDVVYCAFKAGIF